MKATSILLQFPCALEDSAQEPICWAVVSQDGWAGLGSLMCVKLSSGSPSTTGLTMDLSVLPALAEKWGPREAYFS